jgi:glutamate synthase (ferredoxin)
MIERHHEYTGSARAQHVLDDWDALVSKFVRVMPKDFKRAVASLKRAHEQGLSGDEAIMQAFEENARDLARVGGN